MGASGGIRRRTNGSSAVPYVTTVAPSVAFFEIVLAIGLQQCHAIVLAIGRPTVLAGIALIVARCPFVNVKDGETSLGHLGIKADPLAILD